MAWTTPITWAIRDAITMAKLNAHLRDNSNYLFARPRSIVTILGAGTDITTASATNVAIDDAQFTATVNLTGGLVRVNLLASMQHSVNTAWIYTDVIIDDTTYVSSQSATPLTFGLWNFRPTVAAVTYALAAQPFIYPIILASGVHTFKLRWRTTATTAKLVLSGGAPFQFTVEEI